MSRPRSALIGLLAIIAAAAAFDIASCDSATRDCQTKCYPQGLDYVLDSDYGCHCFERPECER